MKRRELYGMSRAPNMIPKSRQSEIVSQQIADFIARGNAITQVPIGVTGEAPIVPPPEASRKGKAKARRTADERYRAKSYRARMMQMGLDRA